MPSTDRFRRSRIPAIPRVVVSSEVLNRASRDEMSSTATPIGTRPVSTACGSSAGGTPAAVGYAQESGIPFGQGLMKNAYVGRTFIQPSQTIRQLGIRLKLNPLRDVIRGKRLVGFGSEHLGGHVVSLVRSMSWWW